MGNSNKTQKFAIDAIIPLLNLPINRKGQIIRIDDDPKALSMDKISELGLTTGVLIEKLGEMPMHGPVQIGLRNSRVAIGHGLAQRIWVKII